MLRPKIAPHKKSQRQLRGCDAKGKGEEMKYDPRMSRLGNTSVGSKAKALHSSLYY